MRQTILLLFLICLALITAAILAYPVYEFLQVFSDIPFHKVISQLSSLCGLLYIFVYLKLNNILDKTTTGFNFVITTACQDITRGVVSGLIIILILELLLLALDIHIPEPELEFSPGLIVPMIIKALVAGIMVALLEEILYRGALLGGLAVKTTVLNALVFSSLIYSAVHFIKFPAVSADINITWYTGLAVLAGAFTRFQDPAITDAFLALFAFGFLLAIIRVNKGNIIQCIGLHAGVVMAIKVANDLTDYNFDNNYKFLVNTYDHQLGYLAFVWLCILLLLYYKFYFNRKKAD